MNQKKSFGFNKGTGTFIYGCMIMMVAFLAALVCIEQYSRYNHATDTQMAADSIADGVAVFMSNENHSYDEAVEQADIIKKIFAKNTGVNIKEVTIDKNNLEKDKWVSATVLANYLESSNADDFMDAGNKTNNYDIKRTSSTSFISVQNYGNSQYSTEVNDDAKKEIQKTSEMRRKLVNFALSKVGGTYVYGGTNFDTGVDCSAFVMLSYRHIGKTLSRTAAAQKNDCQSISRNQLKPGDLLFYTGDDGGIGHVTMYIGGNQVVHASSSKTGIIVSDIGYRTPCAYGRFPGLD